ncbi:MAG: polysaccharide deacetylase family protein, partial [Candidatus Nanopelagicales bacterium]
MRKAALVLVTAATVVASLWTASAAQARSLPLPVTYRVDTKDDVVFITIDDGIVTPEAALDYVKKHEIPITSFLTAAQVTDKKA